MNENETIKELLRISKANDSVSLNTLNDLKNKDGQHYLHLNMKITPSMYAKLTNSRY